VDIPLSGKKMHARTTRVHIAPCQLPHTIPRPENVTHTISLEDGNLHFDGHRLDIAETFSGLNEEQKEVVIDTCEAEGFDISDSKSDEDREDDDLYEVYYQQLSDKKKLKFNIVCCREYGQEYDPKISLFLDYILTRVAKPDKGIFDNYDIDSDNMVHFGDAIFHLPNTSASLVTMEDDLNRMHLEAGL